MSCFNRFDRIAHLSAWSFTLFIWNCLFTSLWLWNTNFYFFHRRVSSCRCRPSVPEAAFSARLVLSWRMPRARRGKATPLVDPHPVYLPPNPRPRAPPPTVFCASVTLPATLRCLSCQPDTSRTAYRPAIMAPRLWPSLLRYVLFITF